MNYTYASFESVSNSNETIQRWIAVGNFIRLTAFTIIKYEFTLACIGVIVNIFHLTILSRKSLRSNSINVIMIGIAMCDLFNMCFEVYSNSLAIINTSTDCWPPTTYVARMIDLWLSAIKDDLRRLTPWLGVLMSSIRFIIIKTALRPKYRMLSKPKFNIIAMSIALFLSTCWSTFYFARLTVIEIEPWTPPPECTGFEPNQTVPQYALGVNTEFLSDLIMVLQIFLLTDGTLKIIPTILFPILTCLLIRELKGAENHRQKLSVSQKKEESSRGDHTTNLVILMTVTFMTAEGPLGIIFVIQGLVTNYSGLLDIAIDLTEIFNIFVAINATTHCLICLAVSTQYRKTVKELFFCGKCATKKSSTIIVSTKISVTSMTNLRQVA